MSKDDLIAIALHEIEGGRGDAYHVTFNDKGFDRVIFKTPYTPDGLAECKQLKRDLFAAMGVQCKIKIIDRSK